MVATCHNTFFVSCQKMIEKAWFNDFTTLGLFDFLLVTSFAWKVATFPLFNCGMWCLRSFVLQIDSRQHAHPGWTGRQNFYFCGTIPDWHLPHLVTWITYQHCQKWIHIEHKSLICDSQIREMWAFLATQSNPWWNAGQFLLSHAPIWFLWWYQHWRLWPAVVVKEQIQSPNKAQLPLAFLNLRLNVYLGLGQKQISFLYQSAY